MGSCDLVTQAISREASALPRIKDIITIITYFITHILHYISDNLPIVSSFKFPYQTRKLEAVTLWKLNFELKKACLKKI